MSDFKGTTRSQTNFLRKLKRGQFGMVHDGWPSALLLRRWMRRQRFRELLHSMIESLAMQADLHLMSAGAQAARTLEKTLAGGIDESTRSQFSALVSMMRMTHARLRHAEQLKQYAQIHKKSEPLIYHPSHTPERARELFRKLREARARGPDVRPGTQSAGSNF